MRLSPLIVLRVKAIGDGMISLRKLTRCVRLGAAFPLLLAPVWAQDGGPIRVVVSDTVAVENVKRFGMNLTDTWWDAGAITNDRAVYNFEGTSYRSIFWGPAQDAQGLYTWQNLTSPPENYHARERVVGADFLILNGPAKGRTGKIVDVRRQAIPGDAQGRETDYLVFDQEVPASDLGDAAVLVERDGLDEGHYNTVGAMRDGGGFWLSAGAELIAGDVDPNSFGRHALKLDGTAGPAHLRLPGKKPAVAEAKGTWSVSFRAKALSGEPVVRLTEPGQLAFTPGPQWGEFRGEFEVPAGFDSDLLTALLQVSGGVVLMDDVVLRHEEYAGETAFSQLLVDELRRLRPGVLRSLQMGGSTVENMLRPCVRQFRFSSSPWMQAGPNGVPFNHAFSLPEFYELCATVGADPWYCLPGVIYPEEVERFMEYLAAPADIGWGRVRAEQGRPEPWTEVFDEIIVEFGNEAWNGWGPFQAGGYNGPDYWASLIEAGKSSPYYHANIKFTIAGQNVNSWLNARIAANAPEADVFAIATYLLHGLDPELEARFAEAPEEAYPWLFGVAQTYVEFNEAMRKNLDTVRKYDMELAVYETNHHAASGKASSAFRNRFLTGVGGGLSVIQNLCIMLQEYDARLQCFFTLFGESNNAYEVKDVRLFGALLEVKEDFVRRRPHYLALMAANAVMGGDLLEVEFPDGVPTFEAPVYDEKAHAWKDGTQDFTALRVLAFADGEDRSMILLNLSPDASVSVQLELPGAPRGGVVAWTQLTADSLDANNERESGEPMVDLRDGQMKDFHRGRVIPLPPASLTTLRWKE